MADRPQGLDPERRRQLDEERDFLMQSLDDLELEHESGGIDDESYAELHDDYTARAAGVIRTLRDGVDVTAPPPPRSPQRTRRRVVLVSLVLVFAIGAGTSLAYALGARLPGQTSSGNSQAAPSTTNATQAALSKKIDDLQAKVNASPDDYDVRLDLARAYEENGDLQNALKQSDAAITIDANRPEGHANSARLLYLASEVAPAQDAKNTLIAQALAGLNQAITVGPDYPDSYYFRAVLYSQSLHDDARAQVDLQNYLLKAPTGTWAALARQLLAQVTTALESPSTTVPPTSTTRKTK
ncbi:MAG TPA: tetratricopeptide repeat protein [Acidimicrobiia bacterium]|jgi:tetratricopeptide (TPR) repeat protein